jgi:hypothetical protein
VGGKKVTERLRLRPATHARAAKPGGAKHLLLLIIIIIGVTVVYANVTGAYFCAYDDFINLHQTVFEDAHQPSLILTTSHSNSYKYRPLQRLINLFTNFLGDGNPTVFRVRNLAFHLVNVVLVYALAWQLFKSARVSAAGALLFGLHPLTNQSVIGAIWTNTVAHTGFLLALVMFVASTRAKHFWSLWLIGALLSASLSLFTYDSAIVVFGLMVIYWLLFVIRRAQPIRVPYVALFVTVSSVFLGLYFVLRRLFVPNGWEQVTAGLPSSGVIGNNIVMYLIALLNPVDLVLANQWFDTPLPSEITLNNSILVAVGVLAVFIVSSTVVYGRRWVTHNSLRSPNIDWATILLLILGIGVSLLPMLAFSSHPSETYLYLPVAFYVLVLAYVLEKLFRETRKLKDYAFYLAIGCLAGIFCIGTWVRNQRIIECAQTAYRILHTLPDNVVGSGSWTLAFANIPGERATRRYGFYGFRGIDTIGHGSEADRALIRAVQLVYQNKSLTAKVVKPEELLAFCREARSSNIGVFVHWDGKIETYCFGSSPMTSS